MGAHLQLQGPGSGAHAKLGAPLKLLTRVPFLCYGSFLLAAALSPAKSWQEGTKQPSH